MGIKELAGLLKRAKTGFLVRVDVMNVSYSAEGFAAARKLAEEFVRDLYRALGTDAQQLLFGAL